MFISKCLHINRSEGEIRNDHSSLVGWEAQVANLFRLLRPDVNEFSFGF